VRVADQVERAHYNCTDAAKNHDAFDPMSGPPDVERPEVIVIYVACHVLVEDKQ
jgi:hypothetical protein